MDDYNSNADFSEIEKAALLSTCQRIGGIEAVRVSNLEQSRDARHDTRKRVAEDRANLAVQQALGELDRTTRLALERLLYKLPAVLRGFASSFLKGHRAWRWEAEDLVGETCRYVLQNNWRALRLWDPSKGTLKGYLWRAMRYRWLNFLKPGPLAQLWVSLDDVALPPDDETCNSEASRDELMQELAEHLLRHGIKDLDIKMLCLKLLDNLSTEEIAIRLGMLEPRSATPPDWEERRTTVCNTIDQRYRRAKHKLSRLLLGDEPATESGSSDVLVSRTGERSQKPSTQRLN